MKKILASILLFVIAVASIINCFAKVDLTKENLQNAYNELAKKYEGGYKSIKGAYGYTNREEKTPIKVEDGELKIEEELFDNSKEIKTVKYDLSDKPTFYVEQLIDKDTSLSELYDIFDNMELPIYGAVGYAIVQGVNPITASTIKDEFNVSGKIRKFDNIMLAGNQLSIGNSGDSDEMRVFKEGETDNFEFLEYAINDEAEYRDEILNLYTYKFNKLKKNDDLYLLRAELVVNLDANLSSVIEENTSNNVVNNTSASVVNNTVNSTVGNRITINPINNVVNNTTNKVNNVVNNTSNNTVNNIVNNTTSKNKMPYVGSSTVVLNLVFVCTILALYFAIRIEMIGRKTRKQK